MLKKVFITGAAGFIGFHLASQLKKLGIPVIGYDNFNPYYNPQLKIDRVQELKKQGLSVIEGDICDSEKLNSIISLEKPSHIVHLAAQAGVRYSLANPHAYIESNVEGFVNILETARKLESVKLIYASSSSVYGLNQKIPFSENDNTDRQASLYGATKKMNELMAQTYHHLYGLPVIGLRFFTVYGPWGRPDMAYFKFADAIMKEETIDIYNHGQMKRDFTYIDDIIQGILASLNLEAKCEVFNLGNHQPVDLINFIETVEKALGKKAKKQYLPMQAGDVLVTYADIEKSRRILGFNPKVSIEEGIPKFVAWYKQYYHSMS